MVDKKESNVGPVRRIRIRWSQGKWAIIGERRIPRMTLPKSIEVPSVKKKIDAFWIELRNQSGEVLYRKQIPEPNAQRVEIANPDGTFTNYEVDRPDKEFDILVPDISGGKAVHFFGLQRKSFERLEAAEELGKVSLPASPTKETPKKSLGKSSQKGGK